MIICRINDFLRVDFSNGEVYTTDNCDEALWEFVKNNRENESIVKEKLLPKTDNKGRALIERVKKSSILTLKGNSVYMMHVSEQSIPEDFVVKILDAEDDLDEEAINKYINFWTLVSLNPDSRVRNNLFWFIRKWDMKITESGLIVAYRNAVMKTQPEFTVDEAKEIINKYYEEKYLNHNDPCTIKYEYDYTLQKAYDAVVNGEESPVFTDAHSHTTTIKLGHPVSIPREECDSVQEHTCSQGLHCASKGWLKENYFGDVGLMVLVNPAKVVAVPPEDSYGKMRTCEYFPVAIVDFDSEGEVIEPEHNLYNDVLYLKELKYEGTINNKDIDMYEISQYFATREELYDNILSSLNAD